MPVNYRQFIHPDDKKAIDALSKIPLFNNIVKKFNEIFPERFFHIENLSSNLKLGPNQLPEIYNLLPPICKKLNINEPELYLKLDRQPNPYTFGDTHPFIVITSGLIELMNLDEIQTIIAHECGHILCRHVVYHTIGTWILNASNFILENFGLSQFINVPLKIAFFHWLRCSELSADRVAAYFCGDSNKYTDALFRLTGATKNLNFHIDKELFMQQTANYKYEIENSNTNQFLEFLMYSENSHPLLAYRVNELELWCKSDAFFDLLNNVSYFEYKEKNIDNGFSQIAIEKIEFLDGNILSDWFKDRRFLNGHEHIIIHCFFSNRDFSQININKENLKRTVYQLIIDKNNEIVAQRMITYSTINSNLEKLFIDKQGIIIVDI